MKKVLSFCVLLLATNIANAAGQYFSVNYMMLTQTFEVSGIGGGSLDANPPSLLLKVGNRISPNLALEAAFGLGISDDTYFSGGGATINGKLNNLFGANVLAIMPLSSTSEFYGKFGLSRMDVKISGSLAGSGSGSESYNDNGVDYGIGMKAGINNGGSIVIEYVQYPDVDLGSGAKIKSKSFNIGYQANF